MPIAISKSHIANHQFRHAQSLISTSQITSCNISMPGCLLWDFVIEFEADTTTIMDFARHLKNSSEAGTKNNHLY